MNKEVLLSVHNLVKDFTFSVGLKKQHTYAVNGVTLDVYKGETLGIVGESGCGKSTFGRVVLKLIPKTSGEVIFDGIDVYAAKGKQLKELRKRMQIVFQDPAASLNPRMKIGQIVAEPLRFHEKLTSREKTERVQKMLELVHLPEGAADKYPHEFSGGQQQRVGIARALITNPEFIVCDEAVSALDVSVQAQILNLLASLKKNLNLTCLFISHNLSVIRHVSDRIAVMYLGELVELGTTEQIFNNPLHPYTQALLSAIPTVSDERVYGERIILEGDLPSPMNLPEGCKFHTRCPKVCAQCWQEVPQMTEVEQGHFVSCWQNKRWCIGAGNGEA